MKRLLRDVHNYEMGKENFGTFVIPKDIDIVDTRTFRNLDQMKTLIIPKFLKVETDVEIGGIFERNFRLREVLFLPGSINNLQQIREFVKLFDEFDPYHIDIYTETKFVEPFKQELHRAIIEKQHVHTFSSPQHFDILPIEKHKVYGILAETNDRSKGKE